MQFDRAIRYVERELLVLREELVAGTTTRWGILLSALVRHWNHRIENIILIEMQRPLATRVETAVFWNRVARRVNGFASPVFIIQTPPQSQARLAFGEHWLTEAANPHPMAELYDVLQTVGGALPWSRYTRGSTAQTIDWTERFAARQGIKVLYDRTDSGFGFSLGGTVVVDRRGHDAERGVRLLSVLAQELVRRAHQDSPSRYGRALEAHLAAAVAFVVVSASGLDPLVRPPDPPEVGDCGITHLVDWFVRIQSVAALILEGLQVHLCEDLPV